MDRSSKVAVAIFDTHQQAADAVRELQRGGFDMRRLSIVGRDYHTDEHVVGHFNAGDRARFFGKYGVFWGGLAGMLRRAAPAACAGDARFARVARDGAGLMPLHAPDAASDSRRSRVAPAAPAVVTRQVAAPAVRRIAR